MTSQPTFRVVPLAAEFVAAARQSLIDCLGHPLVVSLNEGPSNPCRFTLRMLRPGERRILMSHSPFQTDHPYREIGPIFISAEADTAYRDLHRWPPDINPATRVFRAYNRREEIVDARVGTSEPERLIADLFANPSVECIHVRSLTYGCFTFKIERAESSPPPDHGVGASKR